MKELRYPTVERIVEYNILTLTLIKVKRGDKAKVLSLKKLGDCIEICKQKEGDMYDKAAVLLIELVRKHPFASGNRRTAVIVTKAFLMENNQEFGPKDEPSQARTLLGIREGYYSEQEVREWIKNGNIREFKR